MKNNSTTDDNIKTNEKKKNGSLSSYQMRYLAATTIVMLILIGICVIFLLRVYFVTESSCYKDLETETENSISELENNFRSDRTMLRVIASLIGNADDIASMEVSGYLSNYNVNSLIAQSEILLPDNEIITAKGRNNEFAGASDYNTECQFREHISILKPYGQASATTIVRNYVPIWKDGICIGLLYSSANPSNLAKAWMHRIYDGKGYFYVIDRKNGDVIISNVPEQLDNINNISFSHIDSSYTKDGTIKNILNGKKGYSVFKSEQQNEEMYMCYLPFDIEDWEMVILVPESAVFSEVSPVRNGIVRLIIGAMALILLYALWLIREIRKSISQVEKNANTDVLTGLQNRNRYEAYLKKIKGSKEKLTCIYVDANGLHELNNTKGHYAGDQMLRFIADTLKIEFGEENIYRIGGDEFVVFQSEKTENEVNACIDNFNEAIHKNDYNAAVGISTYSPGMSIDQFVKNAETAMYEAKQEYYKKIGKVMRV